MRIWEWKGHWLVFSFGWVVIRGWMWVRTFLWVIFQVTCFFIVLSYAGSILTWAYPGESGSVPGFWLSCLPFSQCFTSSLVKGLGEFGPIIVFFTQSSLSSTGFRWSYLTKPIRALIYLLSFELIKTPKMWSYLKNLDFPLLVSRSQPIIFFL